MKWQEQASARVNLMPMRQNILGSSLDEESTNTHLRMNLNNSRMELETCILEEDDEYIEKQSKKKVNIS